VKQEKDQRTFLHLQGEFAYRRTSGEEGLAQWAACAVKNQKKTREGSESGLNGDPSLTERSLDNETGDEGRKREHYNLRGGFWHGPKRALRSARKLTIIGEALSVLGKQILSKGGSREGSAKSKGNSLA